MKKGMNICLSLIFVIINGCTISNDKQGNKKFISPDFIKLINRHFETIESNIYLSSEIINDTLIIPGINDLVCYFSYRSDVRGAFDAFWGYTLQIQIPELDSIELNREYDYTDDKIQFEFHSYNAFSQKNNDDISNCTIQFIEIDTSMVQLIINLDLRERIEIGEPVIAIDSTTEVKYIKTKIISAKDTVYEGFNNDTIIIRKTYTS